MDRLDELPSKVVQPTPTEASVIQRYFTGGEGDTASSDEKSGGTTGKSLLYLVIYATLLFLVLANPVAEGMSALIPYAGQIPLGGYLVRALVFALGIALIYKFAL